MRPDQTRAWSEPKRTAAVSALVLAVRVDGRVDPSESQALTALLSSAGLHDLALLKAADAKVGTFRSTQQLAAFGQEAAALFTTPAEREQLCLAMLKLAFADGVFAPQEQGALSAFATGLGVAPAKLEELAELAADESPHAAAAKGRLAALTALLDRGVSVNARDANQWTPLHVAVACGQAAAVDLLLKRGADVKARHAQGSPPLFNACNKPYAALVEKLIAAGASVHDTGVQQLTALHLATMAGQLDVARALRKAGASLEAADANGRTALHVAAGEGRVELLTWLLAEGASPNALTPPRCTPLHFAATRGDVRCLGALLDRGAALEAADVDGQTALHYAARNRPGALKYLLERSARVDAASAKGVTPLHLAAAGGFTTCVRHLLEHGAKVDAKNVEAGTPLFGAMVHDRRDVCALLLAAGAATVPEDVRGAAKTVKLHCLPLDGVRTGDGALPRLDDLQLAVYLDDDRGIDQVLVLGRDRRGRPEYVSPRKSVADPRSRFVAVQLGERRLLPLFTSDDAAAAFRKQVALGWPEDGLGLARAVTGTAPPNLLRGLGELPLDGAVLDPFGPGDARVLSLEECDAA